MAALGPGEDGRKRARPDSWEQTVLEPGHIHAAKTVRLATNAAETGAAAELLGGEEKFVYEAGGENPLRLQKERQDNGEDDICKCVHDNVPWHIDFPQPLCAGRSFTEPGHAHIDTVQSVSTGQVSNEADPINEDKLIFAQAGKDSGKATLHIDTVQSVCTGQVFNEADPINEDKLIFAQEGKASGKATLGPLCFTSSRDMLDFFYRLLHGWPLNLNINKFEHMMLEDLLKKGHHECSEKVGTGIKAFQVRINREFSSRCFYVIRKDGSNKDFSYRKCVDNILPLPKLLAPHFHTSNQKAKGCESLLKNKVSNAQGSKTQLNTKGRGRTLDKDRGSGRGNLGGIRRGIRGGEGRGKHGGLGSCIRGAGCKV